jgi:hypothetical protein
VILNSNGNASRNSNVAMVDIMSTMFHIDIIAFDCLGIWDCINGDDEFACLSHTCPAAFACNDSLQTTMNQARCYTWSERCNGNPFCIDRTDEKFCSNHWCNSNNGTFLCRNLNCIFEVWRCDGT